MKETKDRVLELCKDDEYFSCPATATATEIVSAETVSAKQVSDNMVFGEYKSQKDPFTPKPQPAPKTPSFDIEHYKKSEVRKTVYRITKRVA